MVLLSFVCAGLKCAGAGGLPRRRALAALAKLNGAKLERRWPFLVRAPAAELNLGLDDVLEFQRWRSRDPVFLVIGAFDGVSNDPTGEFIRAHDCRAVLVEPQPAPFERLRRTYQGAARVDLVNAAVDQRSGTRTMYAVAEGSEGLPAWTEQLASFDREHLVKHQDAAPGVADKVVALEVDTVSFDDLISRFALASIDVLQIDAEGMDALLLEWFPFERVRPQVVHYEVAHMSEAEADRVAARLSSFGYRFAGIASTNEATAVVL